MGGGGGGFTIESLPEEVFGDIFIFLPFSFAIKVLTTINRRFYGIVYRQVHKARFSRKDLSKDVTFADLVAPVQKFTSLSELSFIDFEDAISDSLVKKMLSSCTKSLRHLRFINCTNIESIDLSEMSSSLGAIKFNGCEQLKSVAVSRESCKSLRVVDFSGTLVGDKTIRTILSYVTPHLLKRLVLFDCLEVKDFPPFLQVLKDHDHDHDHEQGQEQEQEQEQKDAIMMDIDSTTPERNNNHNNKSSKSSMTMTMMMMTTTTTMASSRAFRLECLDLSYCFRLKFRPLHSNHNHNYNHINHNHINHNHNINNNTTTATTNTTTTTTSAAAACTTTSTTVTVKTETGENIDHQQQHHQQHQQYAAGFVDGAVAVVVEELILRRTLITDQQLAELLCSRIAADRLRSINLYGCLHLKQPRVLSICRSLVQLDVSHTHMDDDTLRCIVCACSRHLTTLKLLNCQRLRNPIIESQSITFIDLGFCSSLEAPQIICPALKDLSMRNTGITDAVLESVLAHSAPRLKQLTLSQCIRLEKPNMFNRCPALEVLHVNACESLTSLNLSGCTALSHLNLSECKLTDEDLDEIVRISGGFDNVDLGVGLVSLKTVDLRWCKNIRNPSSFPPHVTLKR